jgi:hypothetical protein
MLEWAHCNYLYRSVWGISCRNLLDTKTNTTTVACRIGPSTRHETAQKPSGDISAACTIAVIDIASLKCC